MKKRIIICSIIVILIIIGIMVLTEEKRVLKKSVNYLKEDIVDNDLLFRKMGEIGMYSGVTYEEKELKYKDSKREYYGEPWLIQKESTEYILSFGYLMSGGESKAYRTIDLYRILEQDFNICKDMLKMIDTEKRSIEDLKYENFMFEYEYLRIVRNNLSYAPITRINKDTLTSREEQVWEERKDIVNCIDKCKEYSDEQEKYEYLCANLIGYYEQSNDRDDCDINEENIIRITECIGEYTEFNKEKIIELIENIEDGECEDNVKDEILREFSPISGVDEDGMSLESLSKWYYNN